MGIFSRKKKELTEEQKKNLFYKKIKILNKNLTESEIHSRIYDYIKKGKKLDLVYLTKEQQNDIVFMAGLYNNEIRMRDFYKPNNELKNNVMFMKGYARICLNELMAHSTQTFTDQDLLDDLSFMLDNNEFIIHLIESYPGFNFLSKIKDYLTKTTYTGSINNKKYLNFIKILNELPFESFKSEVLNTKGRALKLIDFNHKYYVMLAKELVNAFGFDGLDYVDEEVIKNNKDLVYSAYHKDGYYALYRYITLELLNKNSDNKYKKERAHSLRAELFKDRKINKILEQAGLFEPTTCSLDK